MKTVKWNSIEGLKIVQRLQVLRNELEAQKEALRQMGREEADEGAPLKDGLFSSCSLDLSKIIRRLDDLIKSLAVTCEQFDLAEQKISLMFEQSFAAAGASRGKAEEITVLADLKGRGQIDLGGIRFSPLVAPDWLIDLMQRG